MPISLIWKSYIFVTPNQEMTWFAWKSSNTRMKRSDRAVPNSGNAHLVSFLSPALLLPIFKTLKCTCSCTCIKLFCWLFQAMMLHNIQYMTTIVEVMQSRGDWYNILIVLIHVLLQESQDMRIVYISIFYRYFQKNNTSYPSISYRVLYLC